MNRDNYIKRLNANDKKLRKKSVKIYDTLEKKFPDSEVLRYYWNMHYGNEGFSTKSIFSVTENSNTWSIILPPSHFKVAYGETANDFEEQQTRSRIYYEWRNDTTKGFSFLLLFNFQNYIDLKIERDKENKETILRRIRKIDFLIDKFEKYIKHDLNDFAKEVAIIYTDDNCRRFGYFIGKKNDFELFDNEYCISIMLRFLEFMQPKLEVFLQKYKEVLRSLEY